MTFLYDNEWDDTDYTLTESSENASYPVENTRDFQLTKKFWTTGDTAEWAKVDGGSSEAITANAAYIAGHNLTNGGTYAIEGNDTDAWGTPTVDTSITWRAGVMIASFGSDDLRYWRFNLADASNPDGVLKIGKFGIGTAFTLTQWAKNSFVRRTVDTSDVRRSPTGQLFGDEKITYLEYDFEFSMLTDADRTNLEAMWDHCKKVKSLLFVPNASDLTLLPMYCNITNFELTHIIAYQWAARLTLTEQK